MSPTRASTGFPGTTWDRAERFGPTVARGVDPLGVAVSPDGAGVYVADYGSDTVSQCDLRVDGGLHPKSTPAVATWAEDRFISR
jgi:DNA-binding beta-propeller fold protein YncE